MRVLPRVAKPSLCPDKFACVIEKKDRELGEVLPRRKLTVPPSMGQDGASDEGGFVAAGVEGGDEGPPHAAELFADAAGHPADAAKRWVCFPICWR